jgi:hypothetical protein
MRKLAAIVASLLIVSVCGHGQKKESKVTEPPRPDIEYHSTFLANTEIYNWFGGD